MRRFARPSLPAWFACVAVAMALAACGGSSHGIDGGDAAPAPRDAGPARDTSTELDTGLALDSGPDRCSDPYASHEGCPCSTDGQGGCIGGGRGSVCCGGRISEFYDGPCMPPPDGAVPTCDSPERGCPCDTEGAIECRSFLWRLVCTGGVWIEQNGRMCC